MQNIVATLLLIAVVCFSFVTDIEGDVAPAINDKTTDVTTTISSTQVE